MSDTFVGVSVIRRGHNYGHQGHEQQARARNQLGNEEAERRRASRREAPAAPEPPSRREAPAAPERELCEAKLT